MPGKREWAALATTLGLAAWTRVTSWPQVLGGGEVWPLGGDACYHLRRAMRTRGDFPSVPVHDPLMNWPEGAACHWPPGFDLLLAAPGWALGLEPGASARAALWVPLLLGLVVVVAAWVLARRLLPPTGVGRAAALMAPLTLVALPQAASISRFGRTDHHAAEAVTMALLGLWALAWRPGREVRARWGYEVAGAAIAAFGVATFAGSVLYVALACVLLGLASLVAGRRAWVGTGGIGLLGGAAAAAAMYAPVIAEHGRAWSYAYPSWLQPSLLGIAGLGLLTLTGVSRLLPGHGVAVGVRRAAAGGLAGLVGAGGLALTPLRAVVADALGGFVGRQDPWLAAIAEFQPLIRTGESVDLSGLWTALSGHALLVPIVAGAAVWLTRRDARRWGQFAIWMVLAFALAQQQMRFARVAHIVLAVGVAGLVHAVAQTHAAGGRLVAVAIAGLVLVGGTGNRKLWTPSAESTSAIEEAAAFLDHRDSAPGGTDGVLATWDHGHFLSWGAGRPVGPTGFGTFLDGDAYAATEAAWRGSAANLDALLVTRRMSHAVLGAATFLQRVSPPEGGSPFIRQADGTGALNSDYFAALPVAATILGGSGLGDGRAEHLPRLRPVHASTATVGGLPFAVPVLFVFERVPGAHLRGQAEPGAPVLFKVVLDVRGAPLRWIARATAGPDGAWALSVPVATGVESGGIRTPEAAALRVGNEPVRAVEIPLAAVRQGLVIRLESPLPPEAPGGP